MKRLDRFKQKDSSKIEMTAVKNILSDCKFDNFITKKYLRAI